MEGERGKGRINANKNTIKQKDHKVVEHTVIDKTHMI